MCPIPAKNGPVRLTFNRKWTEIGPGQFKVDPTLIKTGGLDSVIKQVIFESNVFNCEINEIINAYEERNVTAVPILAEIVAIRDRRKTTGNLADEEQRENELITNLNNAYETLPTMDQLHTLNRNRAGLILTEIQNVNPPNNKVCNN